MRWLAKSLKINKFVKDNLGLNEVYDQLECIDTTRKYTNYIDYLPAIQFAYNNSIYNKT